MEQVLETMARAEVGGNGKRPASPGRPPALYEPLKLKKEVNVAEQPVPSPGPLTAEEIDGIFGRLTDLLSKAPFTLFELIFRYRARAAQATEAWKAADQEAHRRLDENNADIERQKSEFNEELAEKRAKRDEAEEQLFKAGADYAAALPTGNLRGSDKTASPEVVEDLLDDTAPEPGEISGDNGEGRLAPPSTGEQVLMTLFEALAPLLAGFVLAVTFGTLAGFVTLNDIVKGDRIGLLIGCGLLGFIIVYAVGHLAQYAVESTVDSLQTRRQGGSPALRWAIVIAACLGLVLLCISSSEIKTEAEGLRSLHEQRNAEIQRLNPNANVGLLPSWAYILMGTIASGSYVACKAGRTWRKCQLALQESWQASRRRAWIEAKRAEPAVRLAFALAGTIVLLKDKISSLNESIARLEQKREELKPQTELDEKTRERLDYLYAVAAAEAARLFDYIRELKETYEPARQARRA